MDAQLIEAALSVLVGQPFCATGRAADMEMFDLGGTRERVIRFGRRKGETAVVHDFSLHIQCAWRVRTAASIVVGSSDVLYRPGPEPYNDDDSWNPHAKGAVSRRDERLRAWLAGGPYEVLRVRADAVGGFTLDLAGGYVVEVFPSSSLDGEHSEYWRLLPPEGDHFVVGGGGISS